MIDPGKRKVLTLISSAVGGLGIVGLSIPFVRSLLPSARTEAAGAPVEVDLSSLSEGELRALQWRGKPVWLLKRSREMLEVLPEVRPRLRDPDSEVSEQQPAYARNPVRSIKPSYFVCIGLCTHLGCVPNYRPEVAPLDLGQDWRGGFFCPCHGSRFDLAGRVYKGVPAPTNLIVPPHQYLDAETILIGDTG